MAEAPCPGSDRTQASIVHSLWWIWYTLYFVFNCVLHVLTISPMPSHSAEDRPEQSSHRMHLTLVRIQGVRSFKRTARISPSIRLGFLILFCSTKSPSESWFIRSLHPVCKTRSEVVFLKTRSTAFRYPISGFHISLFVSSDSGFQRERGLSYSAALRSFKIHLYLAPTISILPPRW